jgi:CHRD domain
MLQRSNLSAVALFSLAGLLLSAPASADQRLFFATLSGFEEVPALVTGARGTFVAVLVGDELRYQFTWSGLEGSDPAGAVGAHIHIGQKGANGNIMAFLCGGPLAACSGISGSASGAITAADVGSFGSAAQGVGPGEFEDFLTALRAGTAYVNLHTPAFPGGEIRGQVR